MAVGHRQRRREASLTASSTTADLVVAVWKSRCLIWLIELCSYRFGVIGPFLLRPWRCAPAHPLVSGRRRAPSNHNRYSRKPEPEGHGRRPNYYWATRAIMLPGRQPPHRRCGKLEIFFASAIPSTSPLLG